jgi:peptidyl-prolyl cis-trans isomerase C
MAKDPANIKRAKERVLQNFIHEAVVSTWANTSKVEVSKKELESVVEKARSDYPDDLSFRKSLANAGLTIDDWIEKIKKTELEKKLFLKLREKIATPSDEELKSYYDENIQEFKEKPRVRLKQILVEKEEDAVKIHKAVTGGEVSAEFTNSKSDITWIEQGTLEVFDRAFSMKTGQWSPVLKSVYGFHIYRVEELKPGRQLPFSEAKDNIRQLLMADREQAAYSAWLEQEIRQASVTRNDAVISAISVETIGEK